MENKVLWQSLETVARVAICKDDLIERVKAWQSELSESGPLETVMLRADLVILDIYLLVLGMTPEEAQPIMGEAFPLLEE